MPSADQKAGLSKISRREFLKRALGFVGAATLTPELLIPKRSAQARRDGASDVSKPKEKEIQTQWNREQILTNTSEFVDAVLSRIEHWDEFFPGVTKPSSIDSFYKNFSMSGDASKSEERRIWREPFFAGFEQFGKRVADMDARVANLVPNDTLSYFNSFRSLSMWWSSLEKLQEIFFPIENDQSGPITPEVFTFEDIDSLINLESWFRNLAEKDSYNEQRSLYLRDAARATDQNDLMQHVQTAWDTRYKDEITDQNEDQYEKRKEKLFEMIDIIRGYFPAAFTWVTNIEIDSTTRSNFDNDAIHLGFEFTRVMDSLEEFLKDPVENNPQGARTIRNVDIFGFVLMHELGHKYDINRFPPQIPFGTHPQDHLDFVETRLAALETAEDLFRGNSESKDAALTAHEIQCLFIDPLFPTAFGIDELDNESDLDRFDGECDAVLKPILTYIDGLPPKERTQLIKASGMEDFFSHTGNTLLPWKTSLKYFDRGEIDSIGVWVDAALGKVQKGEKLMTDTGPASLPKISNLHEMSIKVIEEMQALAHSVYDQPLAQVDKNQINAVLLSTKSLFLLTEYIMLDRLAYKKLISPQLHPMLFYRYNDLQTTYIYEQLLHSMVGPFGEYAPRNTYDSLSIPMEDQFDMVLSSEDDYAKHYKAKYGIDIPKVFISRLRAYTAHLFSTQESIGKVMGASGNILDQYPKLAQSLTDSLGQEIFEFSHPGKGG